MAIAWWKDLCIDASDAAVLGAFWGGVLGLELELQDDGDAVLRERRPTHTIWINRVPEAKTVKHRVHLDVHAASLDPLVELGASVVLASGESGLPWTVMSDPEGGEFCVFLREDHPSAPPAALYELVVDCADTGDSQQLSHWWAHVFGGRALDDGRGFWWVADVPGLPFDSVDFVPVPEAKSVKNRLHWDVTSDRFDDVVAHGARILHGPAEATPWHVCADPAGNEFCVFAP